MSNSTPTQTLNLEALKAGDRAEFARLVETYYELIYRLAVKMLNNPQDAEDVLQETFTKAFRHIGGFDGRSSLSTWLYRIATNEALMFLRRQKPGQISLEEPQEDGEEEQQPMEIVDWCCMPETELMSAEAQRHLDEAVSRLPSGLRAAFVLRDIQGLSTQEAAEVLNLSETALKTRLSRARLQLRENLSGYFGKMVKEEGKRT